MNSRTIPDDTYHAEVAAAVHRLAEAHAAGALPADKAADIRLLLDFLKHREAALLEVFETAYRAGVRDAGKASRRHAWRGGWRSRAW
jgi:hypothetical protein